MCQNHECVAGFIGSPTDAHCLGIINFGLGFNFKLINNVDGIECKATGLRRQHLSWGELGVLHSKG